MDRRDFLKVLGATGAGSILAPRLLLERAKASSVGVLRSPYVQNVRSDRATILWTTTAIEDSFGAVEYSSDKSHSSIVTASCREFPRLATGLSLPYCQYQAEITNLIPGTEYFYRVTVDGENLVPSDSLRFRTAGPGPFKFLAFGDSGLGSLEQFQLAQLMLQEGAALVLHTGDIAYPNGTFDVYERNYFGYYSDLMKRVPFFPCPGNHDCFNNGTAYLAAHSTPTEEVSPSDRGRYYSFDWSNVHFISLDSSISLVNAINGTGGMLEWLEKDLHKTRQFWRIVYFHHPPYATGLNENDPLSAAVRERIVPILEQYGVQLVLSGHEHSYQRTYPIHNSGLVEANAGTVYITTGGGGAGLYSVSSRPSLAVGQQVHHYMRGEVNGSRVTLRAIRPDGQEIDTITIAPRPSISQVIPAVVTTSQSTLSRRGMVRILGQHLAPEEKRVTDPLLPRELSGTVVTLNGRPSPLQYVSNNEIHAHVRFHGRGSALLQVTTSNGSTETLINF